MKLSESVKVRCRHHKKLPSLETNIELNGGVVCENLSFCPSQGSQYKVYFPKDNWRSPTELELFTLLHTAPLESEDLTDVLLAFTIPDELRMDFWELDIENILTESKSHQKLRGAYQAFLTDVVSCLTNNIGFSISGNISGTTIINNPGLRSTKNDPESDLPAGLNIDDVLFQFDKQEYSSQSTVFINLGDESNYILFINLTIVRMRDMLISRFAHKISGVNLCSSQIAKMFMECFPDYPVVRLTVRPGEGYLIPTEHVIHDFSTLGKTEIDVSLLIRASFSVNV